MWTLDTLPPKARKHLPNDAALLAEDFFGKARGVDALRVWDKHGRRDRFWYLCNRVPVTFHRRGYGYTPYEVKTPEDIFSSICFPTLKEAVQYIKDSY